MNTIAHQQAAQITASNLLHITAALKAPISLLLRMNSSDRTSVLHHPHNHATTTPNPTLIHHVLIDCC